MAKTPSTYIPLEPFETTVRRWAAMSAAQLHDSFKLQKIYSGSKNKAYEIWSGRKKTITERGTVGPNGRRKRTKKTIDWGWFDENAHRQVLQRKNPNADYWISTGASMKETDVEVVNMKSKMEDFLIEGEVRFRTTMQMFYVEQGVGANGRKNVRGKNGIKVDRAEPYHYNSRYINEWIPKQGHTHRPSVRQQVNYMARRMKWLAKQNFNFALNTWLQVQLTDMLDTKTGKIHLPYGLDVEIESEVK